MAVPTTISDLSATEASNSPADTESITATTRPSDYLRAHATIIKVLANSVTTDIAAAVADYQPLEATLTALAGGLTAANKIPYATALNTLGELTLDTDGTLAANSDVTLATQKAVKTYADTKNIATQVTPSTSGNVLTSNGTTWTSAAAGGVFSSSYTSASPATLTTNLILAENHSLGAIPTLYQVSLKCGTTDAGYAVGDEVRLNSYDAPGTSSVTTWANATQVGANISGTLRVAHKSTNATTSLTAASWTVVLRAWK